MAAVTICNDFGAQENKVCHCFYCFPICLPWSDGIWYHDLHFLNWGLSQLFHFPLSLSSRGSLVPCWFLPSGWCYLQIWGYWYFSRQSCYWVTTLLLVPSWIDLISNCNVIISSKFIKLLPMVGLMQSILSLAYLNSTQIRTIKNYLRL